MLPRTSNAGLAVAAQLEPLYTNKLSFVGLIFCTLVSDSNVADPPNPPT